MRGIWLLGLVCFLLGGCATGIPRDYRPVEGDLVFQSLPHEDLVDMIEGSTGSPYSHCGIVVRKGEGWAVLEAVGPVQETRLGEWIARGRAEAFAVHRLKGENAAAIGPMVAAARKYLGRPYDIHYEMDDEKIYCSELLYKGYMGATGQPLGKVMKLRELNWKPYEGTIKEIEGGTVPLEREIITPRAVSEAAEVEKVYSRGY